MDDMYAKIVTAMLENARLSLDHAIMTLSGSLGSVNRVLNSENFRAHLTDDEIIDLGLIKASIERSILELCESKKFTPGKRF